MNRFYFGDDLVIDLNAVSCVGYEFAIVGGVSVKMRAPVASDLRKQFRAYKESFDQKESARSDILLHKISFISWAAELVGKRIHRHEAQKRSRVEVAING